MAEPDSRAQIPLEARVVLLRHGETLWARTGRHTGRTDVPLTPLGEIQAAASGERLRSLSLRNPLVLASPRLRALRTAELAGLTVDQVLDSLAEWDYGDYEGLTTPEIRESVPNWTVFTHPCPGGETSEQIHSRTDLALSLARSQLPERDVVLIGHGHFSRTLIARWLDLPVIEGRRFGLAPAAYSVLGFEHGIEQLISHNVAPEPHNESADGAAGIGSLS